MAKKERNYISSAERDKRSMHKKQMILFGVLLFFAIGGIVGQLV